MPCKHGFGSQIENSMLENHTNQREMVLLHHFFSLLQRARRSQVIFLQRLITRRTQRRRQAALFHVFTSVALQERWPSLSASRRFFQALRCFEHGPERTFGLQGKHSILFARLLLLLSGVKIPYFEQPYRSKLEQP